MVIEIDSFVFPSLHFPTLHLRLLYHSTPSSKMSDVRQRKPIPDEATTQPRTDHEDEPSSQQDPPDLRPDLSVVVSLLIALIIIITTYYYYRVDLNSKGPFATFVNSRILGRDIHAPGGFVSSPLPPL